MVQSGRKNKTAYLFLYSAISLLAIGMLFGLLGAFQYISSGFIKNYLSFEKVRPLHVSSVVFWIILAAVGAVLNYFQEYSGRRIYSSTLVKIQYWLLIGAIISILISYIFGIFGGREYWEFHPILAIPIATAWILFLINFFKSVKSLKNQPVYVWMWLTGVVFFMFTFIESYLWLIPYFRQNIINDMTVQWKSYGSMVGSWNMLIYGCSIYLIDKISGNKHYGVSKIGFAIYFLGLFNLMFNWGHHIYTLPTLGYIKYISYLVSMTELILFFRILYLWKSSLNDVRKNYYHTPYRFLMAADLWVFLTLVLALAMSVPAINLYTHGTHVTVAHTMGATIGINTFLLFAFVFDILWDKNKATASQKKWFEAGYWLAFISLPFFWISLIIAGVVKAHWQMSAHPIPFSMMMTSLRPYFIGFFVSGIFLFSGFFILIYLVFRNGISNLAYRKQLNIFYPDKNILQAEDLNK